MKKLEADRLQRLSIFELNQKGFLLKESSVRRAYIAWIGANGKKRYSHCSIYLPSLIHETGYIEFFSSKTAQLNDIGITSTKCNFGGMRHWFLCPVCERRVGVLYNLSGLFMCRHCGKLTYSSRNQTKAWKCNVSIPDLQEATEQVRRKYYNGKPTRKYRRLLKMEIEFEESFKRITGFEKERL